MKTFQKFVLIASALMATASFAGHRDNKTLQLTLINNSDTALTYTGSTSQNAGNLFSISQKTIPAHGEAVITGAITQETDLAAALHFKDNNAHDDVLRVIDPRNMHIMQPLFSMRNEYLHSELASQKRGDTRDPRALYIAASTVHVEQNHKLN